ncbi:uncharacterized protein LOC113278299 [Papaver somniferum]|uniref:uncharacterized protein LOC113278299 n=1 Tax=Papaver somniferum TaxID=3469 RepID=UPI000E6FF8F1|nr:uncharacterized protein LOC113278299 [Papaver somniferum]
MARCSIAILLIGVLFFFNTLACTAKVDFKCEQYRVIKDMDGNIVKKTHEVWYPDILSESSLSEALCVVNNGSCIYTCGSREIFDDSIEPISIMADCFLDDVTKNKVCACCTNHFPEQNSSGAYTVVVNIDVSGPSMSNLVPLLILERGGKIYLYEPKVVLVCF